MENIFRCHFSGSPHTFSKTSEKDIRNVQRTYWRNIYILWYILSIIKADWQTFTHLFCIYVFNLFDFIKNILKKCATVSFTLSRSSGIYVFIIFLFHTDSRDKYSGKAVDVWAMGVTLFCFLYGTVSMILFVIILIRTRLVRTIASRLPMQL